MSEDKPFSTTIEVPFEEITIREIEMLKLHRDNMTRVIENSQYRCIGEGDLTPFKVERNRVDTYLNEIHLYL